jgi:hypothetical protein
VTDWIAKGKSRTIATKREFLGHTQKKRDELAKKAREADMESLVAQPPDPR